MRHSLNLKTLTLSVPDEEELQTEFEVEDQGRTFRCILYFVKSLPLSEFVQAQRISGTIGWKRSALPLKKKRKKDTTELFMRSQRLLQSYMEMSHLFGFLMILLIFVR